MRPEASKPADMITVPARIYADSNVGEKLASFMGRFQNPKRAAYQALRRGKETITIVKRPPQQVFPRRPLVSARGERPKSHHRKPERAGQHACLRPGTKMEKFEENGAYKGQTPPSRYPGHGTEAKKGSPAGRPSSNGMRFRPPFSTARRTRSFSRNASSQRKSGGS
ncbi:MAG: hypothetical protein PWP65_143 [Clostridia bacterium]|nr:hypothetical protein [Clostridia bacterium]